MQIVAEISINDLKYSMFEYRRNPTCDYKGISDECGTYVLHV